jgi:hypothetical protein
LKRISFYFCQSFSIFYGVKPYHSNYVNDCHSQGDQIWQILAFRLLVDYLFTRAVFLRE